MDKQLSKKGNRHGWVVFRCLKSKSIRLVALIFIICVGVTSFYLYQDDRDTLPIINPKPMRFITLMGKLDTTLVGYLLVNYATQANKCEKTVNFLEGVKRPRYWSKKYPIKATKTGSFKLKIPGKALISGRCGWQMNNISFHVAIKGESELSYNGVIFVYNQSNKKTMQNTKHIDSHIICYQDKSMYHGLGCTHQPVAQVVSPVTKYLTLSLEYQSRRGSNS